MNQENKAIIEKLQKDLKDFIDRREVIDDEELFLLLEASYFGLNKARELLIERDAHKEK